MSEKGNSHHFECDTCGFSVDANDYYARTGPCPSEGCKGKMKKKGVIIVNKKKSKEFFVSMTATSVSERIVKVSARSEKDALAKVRNGDIFEKEADNGTFNDLDFERGQDWTAWPAERGPGEAQPFDRDYVPGMKAKKSYGDYTKQGRGKNVRIVNKA